MGGLMTNSARSIQQKSFYYLQINFRNGSYIATNLKKEKLLPYFFTQKAVILF